MAIEDRTTSLAVYAYRTSVSAHQRGRRRGGDLGGALEGDAVGFRWLLVLLGVCFVASGYLDAWSRESPAHPLGVWQDSPVDTAWLGLTALVVFTLVRNLMRGT